MSTVMAQDDRALTFEELKSKKGIPYTREHLYTLWKAKKFPAPFKINRLNMWMESEIDAYLAERASSARNPRGSSG